MPRSFDVAAELGAHRRQHLVGDVAARPRESNRSYSAALQHRRGHALVDRGVDRPAALAAVADAALEARQLRVGMRTPPP